MIYGNKNKSFAQKAVLQLLQTIIAFGAFWILFLGGDGWISEIMRTDWTRAVLVRRIVLMAGIAVTFLRLTFTAAYLLKRSMGWEEALTIPFAFAIYYIGFSLFSGPVGRGFSIPGIIGIVLFASGALINTLSELVRDKWKRDPANKGKLYTGGLFRYSMHINYFGDLVWVLGLALITGNPWALLVPVLLFCFFAFYNAPMLDRHLAAKYGKAFEEYAGRTKKIIPFIF
jgi:protein-S-isoprenylcysteine O-methyltransferase Ste14